MAVRIPQKLSYHGTCADLIQWLPDLILQQALIRGHLPRLCVLILGFEPVFW